MTVYITSRGSGYSAQLGIYSDSWTFPVDADAEIPAGSFQLNFLENSASGI